MEKRTDVLKFKLFYIFFCFFFLFNFFAFSHEKRPLVPEDILNLKRLSDPQISPNGNWVAFVVNQFENRKTNSEIWLISQDGQILEGVLDMV